MNATTAAIWVQAVLSPFLAGLIWVIQVVHYPLMSDVGGANWSAYHRRHMRGITWIVGPTMLAEAVAALWLLLVPSERVARVWAAVGVLLLTSVWISTLTLQAPAHIRLSASFDRVVHARLVATNWLRTVAWSARAFLAVWMLHAWGAGA